MVTDIANKCSKAELAQALYFHFNLPRAKICELLNIVNPGQLQCYICAKPKELIDGKFQYPQPQVVPWVDRSKYRQTNAIAAAEYLMTSYVLLQDQAASMIAKVKGDLWPRR